MIMKQRIIIDLEYWSKRQKELNDKIFQSLLSVMELRITQAHKKNKMKIKILEKGEIKD